jgi:CHASE2 domain-containing sensor protein
MPKNCSGAFEAIRKNISRAFSTIAERIRRLNQWLGKHRWVSALVVIVIGILVGEWMEEKYAFLDLRYQAYQLTQTLAARIKDDLYDHHTVLVLIEDDEYWAGQYEGRSPINKTHLAELVTALDAYTPKVIALDFNFTSPFADGRIDEHDRYRSETDNLIKALRGLKSKPRIILPKTLGVDSGFYRADSAVYDRYDLQGPQFDFGYIDLPGDYRMIPPTLPMKVGKPLKSFSEAVVGEFDLTGRALNCDRNDQPKCYASGLLSEEQFYRYSATEVLFPDQATSERLAHDAGGNIVIIGGAWSRDAYGRGQRVDTRYTPAGLMPAVFLHAAWVESMLASRTARPMGNLPKWLLELLTGFLTYYVFTRNWSTRKIRYALRVLYLFGLIVFWLLIAYVSSQNLGIFFDPFVPSLASLGKAAFEQVNHWRVDANHYEKISTQLRGPTQ